MLYDYIIIYDYKTEGKKQKIKKYNSLSLAGFTLKRTSLYLIYPKKFHSCTYWYSKVLMCTFLSISYKDVLIRVLLFTYFTLYFVYVVCPVHDTCTFTYYFILCCSIMQSMFQELNKKSNSKQTIAKKLCIELN